jgi:copper chaperone NosL
MSKLTLRTTLPFLAAMAAGALFVISLNLPVWHLKMEAPQYQDSEALRVRVYPGSMQGDLREITVLNKYIGVRIPEKLPELRWLPVALLAAAVLGVSALALRGAARRRCLFTVAALLSLTMLVSAAMAQWQMHRIGHERDPHAALKGVGNFTPPILGRVKVANFTITTGLGAGAFLIGVGILLEIGAGLLSRRREPIHHGSSKPAQVHVPSVMPA